VTPQARNFAWGIAARFVPLPGGGCIALTGPLDGSARNKLLCGFVEAGGGPFAVSLSCSDVGGLAEHFRNEGRPTGDPKESDFALEVRQGTLALRERISWLPQSATPGLRCYASQALPGDSIGRKPWNQHANGAIAIEAVTAVVEDPGAVAIPYAKMFGFDRVRAAADVVEVDTGGGWLRFTHRDGLRRLLPDWRGSAPATPAIAALRLSVADLPQAEGYLEIFGQAFTGKAANGRLGILPPAGTNLWIELVASLKI